MQDIIHCASVVHLIERLLAILGAAACLVITIIIWISIGSYQSMWPLPGFYFVEMVALSIIGASAFVCREPIGRLITWAGAGILFAFSIMGALSVGFFYLPIALLFTIVSISSDVRNKQRIAPHLIIGLITAVAQGVLMFTMIRLVYPSAAF